MSNTDDFDQPVDKLEAFQEKPLLVSITLCDNLKNIPSYNFKRDARESLQDCFIQLVTHFVSRFQGQFKKWLKGDSGWRWTATVAFPFGTTIETLKAAANSSLVVNILSEETSEIKNDNPQLMEKLDQLIEKVNELEMDQIDNMGNPMPVPLLDPAQLGLDEASDVDMFGNKIPFNQKELLEGEEYAGILILTRPNGKFFGTNDKFCRFRRLDDSLITDTDIVGVFSSDRKTLSFNLNELDNRGVSVICVGKTKVFLRKLKKVGITGNKLVEKAKKIVDSQKTSVKLEQPEFTKDYSDKEYPAFVLPVISKHPEKIINNLKYPSALVEAAQEILDNQKYKPKPKPKISGCPECFSFGTVGKFGKKCPTCGGSGKIYHKPAPSNDKSEINKFFGVSFSPENTVDDPYDPS